MAAELVNGAAARRRDRRLRAWHRHERMTVAMELATALHHSAQRVGCLEREWTACSTTRQGDRSLHSRGSGQESRRTLSRREGQSRSVTWLPQCHRWSFRCWPARQAMPSTTPPSSSSSVTPSRRRRFRRRRRRGGGGRWRMRSRVSHSLPPSMRPDTGPPLPPLGRGGKRRRRRGRESSRRPGADSFLPFVDVSVIFNDKFRQSKSYMFSKEPQLQFIDRVLDLPVVQRRRGPHSATVRKTDLIPQVQFLGKVVAPVLRNDSCVVRWCRKLWLSCSCSSSKVVDIPFVPQRQITNVQTSQQITEIPQLQYVDRWSMPAHGSDIAENRGGPAGAGPLRLWTSLCSRSDKFPAVPGGASDSSIDEVFWF